MTVRYAHFRHGDPLVTTPPPEPTVLTKLTRKQTDPTGQLVMDAKSLYDAFHSEQSNQDDARAASETSIIREDMERMDVVPRWVPHDKIQRTL